MPSHPSRGTLSRLKSFAEQLPVVSDHEASGIKRQRRFLDIVAERKAKMKQRANAPERMEQTLRG